MEAPMQTDTNIADLMIVTTTKEKVKKAKIIIHIFGEFNHDVIE